jgi:hypothetical protein
LKNCHFHREIFEAIRRRDGDAAYDIMVKHVGDIQGRVHRSLAEKYASPASGAATRANGRAGTAIRRGKSGRAKLPS